MGGILTAISEGASSVTPEVTAPLIDVSNIDFMQVLNVMMGLLPTMLPVAISCVAFRKGLSFILSFVRGA